MEKPESLKQAKTEAATEQARVLQEIAFCCPIAPFKKVTSSIVESNITITNLRRKIQ